MPAKCPAQATGPALLSMRRQSSSGAVGGTGCTTASSTLVSQAGGSGPYFTLDRSRNGLRRCQSVVLHRIFHLPHRIACSGSDGCAIIKASPGNLSTIERFLPDQVSTSVVRPGRFRSTQSGPPAALDVVLLGGRSYAIAQTRVIRFS